jgi:predicted nucleic acid-binding protein
MGALAAIAIDETDPHRFAEAALEVALRTGVRVPDAAYLETARRARSTLITADRAQFEGAMRMGLAAIPLSEVPARDS